MLGHKILWDSVARTPLHKSGLRAPSIHEFGLAARTGVRDPIRLNLPDDTPAVPAVPTAIRAADLP